MICRRNTIGFVQFIRGQYINSDIDYIQTQEETPDALPLRRQTTRIVTPGEPRERRRRRSSIMRHVQNLLRDLYHQ